MANWGSIRKLAATPAAPEKVEPNTRREAAVKALASGRMVAVLVRVAEPDYVPTYLKVRRVFSPDLFSADVDESLLADLSDDDKVISVGTPRTVHPAEQG